MRRRVLWLLGVVVASGPACGGKVQRDFDGRATEQTSGTDAGTGVDPTGQTDGDAELAAETDAAAQVDRDAGPAAETDATGQADGDVGPLTEADATGEPDPQLCPAWEDEIDWDSVCHWQTLEPPPPDSGRAPIAPCEIPCMAFLLNPNEVTVYVDCKWIPMGPSGNDAVECWWYDSLNDPQAIVLSEPVCSQLQEDGFERIDVLYGCVVYNIDS